jgi:hypothetical protein
MVKDLLVEANLPMSLIAKAAIFAQVRAGTEDSWRKMSL